MWPEITAIGDNCLEIEDDVGFFITAPSIVLHESSFVSSLRKL